MAWIESHQSLLNHPKTRKLARLLDVPRVYAVGHLHALWWWCLDYADDGDLSRFDDDVLADACEWSGDPEVFADALLRSGFVDATNDERHVHDWSEYGGKLMRRRQTNSERMRVARATARADTETASVSRNEERASHVQRTSSAQAATCEATLDNTTVHNTREDKSTESTSSHEDAKSREAKIVALVVDSPYSVYLAFLEAIGAESNASVSEQWKRKQLSVAKRLVENGFGEDKVKRCALYMRSQEWRTSPFDLIDVEKFVGKWEASGMPALDEPKRNGRAAQSDNVTKSLDAIRQVGDMVRRYEQ